MKNCKGFALVVASVAIFLLAILVSAVLAKVDAGFVQSRILTTQGRQSTLKDALLAFVARNGRFPCPADITLASGATNEGVEAITPGTCVGTIVFGTAPNTVAIGAIPWKSLGLAMDASEDAYAHRFTYIVALPATALTTDTFAGLKGVITVHSSGAATAANQTNNCAGALTYNPCAAVFAIISHGQDGLGGYTSSGLQTPFQADLLGTALDSIENANGDNKVVQKTHSDSSTNPYDDLVVTYNVDDILGALTRSKDFVSYRTATNIKFDVIKGAILAYTVKHVGCSGLPLLGACLLGSPYYNLPTVMGSVSLSASQTNDSWLNTIQYNLLSDGKIFSSTTTGDAYSLTSNGPDGVAGTSDDISIVITNQEINDILGETGFFYCNDPGVSCILSGVDIL